MAGKKTTIRQDIAYLYELQEFTSLKKHIEDKTQGYMVLLAQTDMTQPRSERTITFIQGQIKSLDWLLLEFKNIHKAHVEALDKNKKG